MDLAVELYRIRRNWGEKPALAAIRAAGFDCVDFSFFWCREELDREALGEDYKEHAREVRAYMDSIGLSCHQAHAPFDFVSSKDVISPDNLHWKKLVRAMEASAILGAEYIVIHSIPPFPGKNLLESNVEFYQSFEPYAKAFGIGIAIENLYGGVFDKSLGRYTENRFETPEKMKELLQALDSPLFCVCVDVGHAVLTGIEPEDYLLGLDGNTVRALHIHDNDRSFDFHYLPRLGSLHWDKITEALAKIGYEGDLDLELSGFFRRYDKDPKSLMSALTLAEAVGRDLIRQIKKGTEC